MKTTATLVLTDMDGTLLDHHNYDYRTVIPQMKKLEQAGIPVILNTSKTFSELESWIDKLDNRHPFIVENGSAIYIPQDYFESLEQMLEGNDIRKRGTYFELITGTSISLLRSFQRAHAVAALDLTECSLEEAIEVTGLNRKQAMQAQDRQFSIPLQFEHSEQAQIFSDAARLAGFRILKGGRFIHLMGSTDKGVSMLRLKRLYERAHACEYKIIALGDSPNDLEMLEQADMAVVVKSPSSDRLQPHNKHLIRTAHSAPDGWVEGVKSACKALTAQ